MTQRVLRYVAGAIGLLFVLIGLGLLLAPGRQSLMFAIFPSGPAGLSTVRADLAGLFLGMGAFTVAGAAMASDGVLMVPAAFLGAIALGRLLNLIADGPSPDALRSLVVELVAIGVLVLTILSVRRGQRQSTRALIVVPLLLLVGLATLYVFQRPIGMLLVRRFVADGLANQLVTSLPDGLHAGLCGSGAPMPDPTRAGPCVLVIAGRHTFLVDVGEGGPRKLALMGVQPGQVDGVLLTHFHSDHIGGLGELLLQRWGTGSHADQTPVYGPQGVELVVQGFNLAYSLDKGYRIAHHGEKTMPPSGSGGVARPFSLPPDSDAPVVVLQQDGVTITAIPVNHTPVFPAVAYRFDYGGRSLVISGDLAPSPSLVQAARGVDVLFHEGLQTTMVAELQKAAEAVGRAPMAKITADIPSYHTTPEDAAREAAEAGVKQLVFFHTIPPLRSSLLNAAFLGDAARYFKGPITISTDGLLVSMPKGTTEISQRNLL
ncbi:MAG: MBL fold metallo-hydrolase [Vicinamibacterales bacterium]